MLYADHLALLTEQAGALLGVARRDLDVPVPTCREWRVRDLVGHVGAVYAHKVAALGGPLDRPPDQWERPPAGDAVVDYYERSLTALLTALERADPATPSWTWYPPDQTAGFWARRTAQETVVHRVDADRSFGLATPIPDPVAVDGVDEFLHAFLGAPWAEPPSATGVVAVRVDGTGWRVAIEPAGVEVAADVGDAPAAVRGRPESMLLYLWGRAPASAVQITGDETAYAAFRARLGPAAQ